jgi:cobalt-zinc-cadmium efflux system protein
MVAVAIGGLAVNIVSLRILHGGHNHDLNTYGAWLHIIGDLLGSIGAIAAGLLISATGRTEFDAAISVIIAAIIVASSWNLIASSANLLLNGVPRNIDLEKIEAHLRSDRSVLEIHDLHVWAIDSRRTALTCHIVYHPGSDSNALLEWLLRTIEQDLGISHCTLQLEKASADRMASKICGGNAGCYSTAAAA